MSPSGLRAMDRDWRRHSAANFGERVSDTRRDEVREYKIHPSQFGLELYDRRTIAGGEAKRKLEQHVAFSNACTKA
jgi:anthranilate phosphoribosyltransferase